LLPHQAVPFPAVEPRGAAGGSDPAVHTDALGDGVEEPPHEDGVVQIAGKGAPVVIATVVFEGDAVGPGLGKGGREGEGRKGGGGVAERG